jgi:hypothetical protein
MSQEEMHARHLVELGFVEAIVHDLGLKAQLMERSEQVPYHTLLVDLEPDAQERPRQMALSFYPVSADQVEHSLLLQYYIVLPVTLEGDGLARVRAWLPEINNKVVLGHFGITDDQHQLHYRYVQALPADELIEADTLQDVITLTGYTPLLFQNSLEDLAAGDITLEQARANLAAQFT